MCGIAAIFAYSPDAPGVERGELIAIRDQMIKRGPDGCGEYFSPDGRVALGHRRLSIIDLSEAGAQPMWNADHTLGVTFNGEIYNYRELRAELEAGGCRFHSHSDTEVLLHLYQTDGENMVHRLRGMFAFALWDTRRRTLFLARDPFGIKPLYYADDGRTLRAASQVKALLAGGKIDTAPEPAGHVGFFLWGHVPDPFTLYRGIRALPAGHTLTISESGKHKTASGNPVLRSYCSIPEMLRSSDTSDFRVSASQRFSVLPELGSALRDSVAHHLIADVPVGVFLSSGLDSTTLAALAAEQGGALRTVTLGFEEYRGTTDDETPLAELVARQYGAQHQTRWVSRHDFATETDSLFAAMDQPSTDGVNTYFVSQVTRAAGLKVALSGLGGDELFGGYPSFREIPRLVSALRPFQRFSDSAFQLFGKGFRIVTGPFLRRFTSPKYAGLLEYGGSFGGAYLLRRGMFMPWELPEILDPDLVRAGWDRLNTLPALNATADLLRSDASLSASTGERAGVRCSTPTSDLRPPTSASSDRLRVSALELTWYMRNQLLRDSDWAGMAHSLEIRVPLVDTTLLRSLLPALGSATPPTKLDMARSVLRPLPSEVLSRPKTGFTIPVRDWLLASPLRLDRGESDATLAHRMGEGQGVKASGEVSNSTHRGLRGWACEVYARFGGTVGLSHGQVVPQFRSPVIRPPVSSSVAPTAALCPSSSSSASQPFSVSGLSPKRILIFRIGQLGDTIVSLPALWVVRQQFPDAHITLLCDRQVDRHYVFAADLLRGSTLVDAFESYPFDPSLRGRLTRPVSMAATLVRLRARKFDTLIYLAPSNRTREQTQRDRRFFAALGIRNFLGLTPLDHRLESGAAGTTAVLPYEADLLLERLASSGLSVPEAGQGCMDMQLGLPELEDVRAWLSNLGGDGGKRWIAVGPGSKMPAKRWPVARYAEVVAGLIREFDVWPVVFGGREDAPVAEALLRGWGRGYNAAGELNVRAASAALRRCALYLGNDTGTMHLAAAVGTPCVAVFSARAKPGLWYPYGGQHHVFRAEIACQNCDLFECVERKNECLHRIGAAEVLAGCKAVFGNRPTPAAAQVQTTGPLVTGH